MTAPVRVLFDDMTGNGRGLVFTAPERVVTCDRAEDAPDAIRAMQAGLDAGLHAAGFLAYELGYLLEPILTPLMPEGRRQPLIWMGLFREPEILDGAAASAWVDEQITGAHAIRDLRLTMARAPYLEAFDRVKDYIAAGDVYQINLTLKYRFGFEGDPWSLYAALRRRQPVANAAIIATPEVHILSLSPELFFQRRGRELVSRPMKGTARRGATPEEDAWLGVWLRGDEKSRAENLMIVDLLRNDLGRVAEIGSVKVPELYTVERYRTVHQMTSGITATLRADKTRVADLLAALFPCGSVTGAPKVRAMQIIRELETEPRGVYTGAVGYFAPDGNAEFNVAIRTLWLDAEGGEMGIGSGVVADSRGDEEFEECLLKAQFLTRVAADFGLIETLRWQPDEGYYLYDHHLARLEASAGVLGFTFDRGRVEAALASAAGSPAAGTHMVRLVLSDDGRVSVTATPIALPGPATVWRYAVSDKPLDETDPLLFHKTTRRAFYDGEMARLKALTGCDEVVFLNRQGELTEGTRTNIFLAGQGRLLTPRRESGLLPGTLRQDLLERGEATEARLTHADLETAEAVFLGNSVRGLVRSEAVKPQLVLPSPLEGEG